MSISRENVKKPALVLKNINNINVDDDLNEHHEQLENYLAATTNANVAQLDRFLSRPELAVSEKDARTNFFIPEKARYYITGNEINNFFILLEQVRRDGHALIFAEKQDEKSSGITIDVDIYYRSNIIESKIDDNLIYEIIGILMSTIEEIFDLTPLIQVTDAVQIAITKRHRPVSKDHNGIQVMSEGFHILIPGIKISRSAKHFLLHRLIKTGDIHVPIKKALKDYLIDEEYSIIDMNSKHIPAFLVGCKRDPRKPPYELHACYDYNFEPGLHKAKISKSEDVNDRNQSCILVHELSLNHEVPPENGGIIKKRDIYSHIKYASDIESYKSQNRPQDIEEELKLSGEMSLMNLHDPEFGFIKNLLDILAPFRAQEYAPWMEVIMILAGTSEKLRPLGEYFSRKCPEQFRKTGISGFESTWESLVIKAKTLPTGKRKSLGTLIWLAKRDNPERFDKVMKRNILKVINTIAYKKSVSGEFEHADIAEVLYHMFSTKYVTDKKPGEKKLTWFEFVIPGEKMEKGEVFKYHQDDNPRSLERYMSEVLVNIFEKIYEELFESRHNANESKTDKPESTDPEFERKQKRKMDIAKGILKTIRNLKRDGYICSTIKRAMARFEMRGFANQLDQDDNILGVGNGILVFHESGAVELIQQAHDYKISMFTPVDYRAFDPREPRTRHLLKAVRSMFKDDEPDTHLWFMCLKASALHGCKKEPFVVKLIGTGREGKSSIMELWRAVLGQYGRKLPISLLVGERSKSESANPAVMDMENKRGVSYQEPEQKSRFNDGLLKETTGGEKQSARGLFQGQREFEPRCVHIIPTNYLIDISTTDDATWRRIKVIRLQIKFFHPNDTKYNPNDPFHRLVDPYVERFSKDPEYLSAYLSILVYYWQIFKVKYGGKLVNIPHPHIEYETAKYRTSKDSIDEFITRRMVRVPDRINPSTGKSNTHIERVNDIIEKYGKWMDSQAKWYSKSLVESSLENSKIGKMFEQDRISKFLKGLRFLLPNEPKQSDESYVFDVSFGDLFADSYEKKSWKETRDNLKKDDKEDLSVLLENTDINKSLLGDQIVKIDDDEKKEILSEAVKNSMLSDAARSAILSEEKLKVIANESIDEYYNRIVREFESNSLLPSINARALEINNVNDKLSNEILEHEKISRRNEMSATTESYKKYQLEEKHRKQTIIQNMPPAESRIVEAPPLPIIQTISDTDAPLTRVCDEADEKILSMDDDFMF